MQLEMAFGLLVSGDSSLLCFEGRWETRAVCLVIAVFVLHTQVDGSLRGVLKEELRDCLLMLEYHSGTYDLEANESGMWKCLTSRTCSLRRYLVLLCRPPRSLGR